ncbi:D-alanyl-D-alanine carboxypeptidase family protein [Amaricoccus solimangrovi]|uniref:serine-type D-Ala-D-Ala carboxypeptidase n=1 Tax=Amaricoccus solimangrovi TaxID=2589815 RepID=A0A501WXE9_9RHOB|nr:D-alanyl-D-alanine carboxypeptidase family protein [Amaricoccus solimangrovi]TPE52925.1 D-alanyl-D-alanine carboxypeptidase [Amaricoccus solimangrovi]
MPLKTLALTLLIGLLLPPAAGFAYETGARTAVVVDDATGAVLLSKNAETPEPPASMSKLMTVYMLFEALRDGRVTMETTFPVSARAHAMGGSRMFVEIGEQVPVKALIQGIIVQSGNDACVVVAEGLAGSEEEFAAQMTRRAHDLGLSSVEMKNASGWPAEGHVISGADLVALARLLIHEFPEYYRFFSETEFTWNGITQPNRNPLLTMGIGADGLKTGHTSEAGFGLVGSAVRDGQRIVFMMSGLDSMAARASETSALVRWAFGAFDTVRYFSAGDAVTEIPVWLGDAATVPVVAPRDISLLVPRADRAAMTAKVVYDGPVEAPVAKGSKVATLLVAVPGRETARFDLVAGADVARGGLMTRIGAAARLTRDRAMGMLPHRSGD